MHLWGKIEGKVERKGNRDKVGGGGNNDFLNSPSLV